MKHINLRVPEHIYAKICMVYMKTPKGESGVFYEFIDLSKYAKLADDYIKEQNKLAVVADRESRKSMDKGVM